MHERAGRIIDIGQNSPVKKEKAEASENQYFDHVWCEGSYGIFGNLRYDPETQGFQVIRAEFTPKSQIFP